MSLIWYYLLSTNAPDRNQFVANTGGLGFKFQRGKIIYFKYFKSICTLYNIFSNVFVTNKNIW